MGPSGSSGAVPAFTSAHILGIGDLYFIPVELPDSYEWLLNRRDKSYEVKLVDTGVGYFAVKISLYGKFDRDRAEELEHIQVALTWVWSVLHLQSLVDNPVAPHPTIVPFEQLLCTDSPQHSTS